MSDYQLPLEPSAEIEMAVAMGVVREGDRVLELGSFQGHDAIYLAQAGCSVIGLEASGTAIEYARSLARVHQASRRAKFRRGEIPSALSQFEDGYFDFVTDRLLWSNIEGKRALRKCVTEIARILADDGLVLLRRGVGDDDDEPMHFEEDDLPDQFQPHFELATWYRRRGGREIEHRAAFVTMPIYPLALGFTRMAQFGLLAKREPKMSKARGRRAAAAR